jgi:hypothetical protein
VETGHKSSCGRSPTHLLNKFEIKTLCVVLSPDQRFFYWRIFAKFRPEKHGFDMDKGFFMEQKHGPNSLDFENKDSKIARLYDNF